MQVPPPQTSAQLSVRSRTHSPGVMADSKTTDTSQNEVAPLLGGRDASTLIKCNQKLKDLGIDETIKLPQICVIGDQSTGKSSLIEALSTIQVPKAKGCCTQCPIAVNLSGDAGPNSVWTCTVCIEERYEYIETSTRVTNKQPLGPWRKVEDVKTFKLEKTHDKSRVNFLIKAAQAAILHPGTKPADFLIDPDLHSEEPGTKFSPNVIRLDISDAGWPDLSFIDLPGVIANTGKKDKYLVDLIKNLVIGYARDPRSVNMLSLPMTHDIENSQACAILQGLKAEDRTLAVFTKSDLADSQQRQQFLDKFLGADEEQLGFQHGYHIVMMPDSTDLSQIEARQQEEEFFGRQPWLDLDETHRERLGVNALRNYLRTILFEKTAETLPHNLKAIKLQLEDISLKLLDLPEPPNQALLPLKLLGDLTKLEDRLEHCVNGSATFKMWKDNATDFRTRVVGSKPTLVLKTRDEVKALRAAELSLSKERVTASSDDASYTVTSVKKEQSTCADLVCQFRLEEVRTINQETNQSYTLDGIDLKAIDKMNMMSTKSWDSLLNQYMGKSSRLINEQVHEIVHEMFGKHKHLEIYAIIIEWVKKYVDSIVSREWSSGEEVCTREQNLPFTLDVESMKEIENACLAERRKKRAEFRMKLIKARLDAEEGVVRARRDEAREQNLPLDPYDTEMVMSAKTRAYYEIAAKRFTDVICQSIFHTLLPSCGSPLAQGLRLHLGVDDPDKHAQIVSWMTEDKERETLRQRLSDKHRQLVEGERYIQSILGTTSTPLQSPLKRRQSPNTANEGHFGLGGQRSKQRRTSFNTGPSALTTAAADRHADAMEDDM